MRCIIVNKKTRKIIFELDSKKDSFLKILYPIFDGYLLLSGPLTIWAENYPLNSTVIFSNDLKYEAHLI